MVTAAAPRYILLSKLGLVNGKTTFEAYDGPHDAELVNTGIVRLRMNDVSKVTVLENGDYFINTGSPHYIRFVSGIHEYPVFEEGREIRYSDPFKPGGTNVNFVELLGDNTIYVRTYERGVEDETLSCGTGVNRGCPGDRDQRIQVARQNKNTGWRSLRRI